MLSAAIVGTFEDELEDEVLLAFFLPGVVYMSAAIGTQTQTVLIRGFSVGVSTRQVFRRELASGLLLSMVIALVFLPVALLGWGDAGVALGVALALLASSVAATLVAIVLPWAFQRPRQRPRLRVGTARDRASRHRDDRDLLHRRRSDRGILTTRGGPLPAANY